MVDLKRSVKDLEKDKFDLNSSGEVIVRTAGSYSYTGLSTALKNTTMLITSTTVQAPPSPLVNRNSLTIFNLSTTTTVYIGNNDVTADAPSSYPDYTWGQEIRPESFWNVDITNNIAVYLRCKTGESAYVKITEYA